MIADAWETRRLHPSLPVFALETAETSLLYVPGFVMPAKRAWIARFANDLQDESRNHEGAAAELLQCAHGVENQWQAMLETPFAPRCLSLHFPYICNLACSYCFARPAISGGRNADAWNDNSVRSAALEIASHCQTAGEPFHLVVQGAGEATMLWDGLERLVALTREVAVDHGIAWHGHMTTNGQCSPQQAGWLAEAFDSVTLSCDGPPARQDRLRPRRDGQPSSRWVEQSARVLREQARDFSVRATLDPADAPSLVPLVDYVRHILGSPSLRLELIFRRTTAAATDPYLAQRFVDAFARAEKRAERVGLSLRFSGVRLQELHGPYCDEGRQVLRLTPDGTRLGCFLADPDAISNITDGPSLPPAGASRELAIQQRCHDCFNQYHCAKSCPDACPSADTWSDAAETRCRIQQGLALHWLAQAVQGSAPAHDLEDLLIYLPQGVDADAIRDEWTQASRTFDLTDRRMPGAPWNEGGFDLTGEAAWVRVRDAAARHMSKVVAVYVHVPFCGQQCAFCDCHSVAVRRPDATSYINQLKDHLASWCAEIPLSDRIVSTIHFGGGTPLVLGAGLTDLVESLRGSLAITPATEWAIETTASLCGRRELERLRLLGFTRLHVGVQTLDGTRCGLLGRKTADARVMERLRLAVEMGFVTSVDILYGLPGQSPLTVGETIGRMIDCGIHGLSAYRLNRSDKNDAFFRAHPGFQPDAQRDYVMLQCVEHLMLRAGYAKNHFVHYAKTPDDNRYFRHLVRGEDLVALGASASGNIRQLQYRFRELPGFPRAGSSLASALEGICDENTAGAATNELIVRCMAGDIDEASFARCGCAALLESWKTAALVRYSSASGRWVLTGTGSWSMQQMLDAIHRRTRPPQP